MRDVPGTGGERLEFVDVVAAELVFEELRRRRGSSGSSATAPVNNSVIGSAVAKEHGVDRHQAVNRPQDLGLERRTVKAGVAAAHQVSFLDVRSCVGRPM